MDSGVLVGGERAVARDHRRFGDRRDPGNAERCRDLALVHDAVAGDLGVLLVEGEDAAGDPLVLKGPPQNLSAADRQPVVREAQRSRLAQLDHVAELRAAHSASRAGEEAGGHRRLVPRALSQGLDPLRGVQRGLRVGHRNDPAVATCRRRAGPRLQILLVLSSGGARAKALARRSPPRRGAQRYPARPAPRPRPPERPRRAARPG